MKSLFSSSVSKFNVLMICTASLTAFSFPTAAIPQFVCIKTLSRDVVSGQPASKLAPKAVDLTGVWDLKGVFNKKVAQNGFINNVNWSAEYVVEFNSVNGIITGKVLGARSSTIPNVCSNAVIDGKVNGNEVNYSWQYTGSCCPNEKMLFKGKINSQGLLEGEAKPAKIPTSDCSLVYGTITGTKRNDQ